MYASASQLRLVAAGMRSFSMAANKHPGGSLSATEAVATLFFSGVADLGVEPTQVRDRFVCSKGHAAAPAYFAWWAHGFVPGMPLDELVAFGQVGHPLPRMPRRDVSRGIVMSSGSLGQGLSFGLGLAIADRAQGKDSRTYVLLGDGECTEGQVWEAAMTAQRLRLATVVALLDANGSGSVVTLDRDAWTARWSGFGWSTLAVDGHDVEQILGALDACRNADRPTVVILRTIKGKGLLPPVEGSNTLSGEVDPVFRPPIDLHADVDRALEVVDTRYPRAAARRAAGGGESESRPPVMPVIDRADMIKKLSTKDLTTPVATKQIGGEVADELAGAGLLMLSPDAIRNSGLLARMQRVGSWHYDNPSSDVLQCAIAEQDAASLAAGAAAGGLRPMLFSMEGFYWRMLDQIRESIAFCRLPVILVGTSGGVGDPLGPMVQSDTLLLALASMHDVEVFEAGDANTAKLLIAELLATATPAYLRLPHEPTVSLRSLDSLATQDLSSGFWLLDDDDDARLVILTAGAMRDVARGVARRVREQRGVGVRVVEVFGLSRFARLPADVRRGLFPPGAASGSVHNAPSAVLARFLPPGGVAIGVDDWGVGGWPLARQYAAVGLTQDAVFDRLARLL